MTNLPNNCRAGKFSVYPSNWKTVKASLKDEWRVSYYFYDDNLMQKKKVVLKRGLNNITTLAARRDIVNDLINDEMDDILNRGFNPITGNFSIVTENEVSEFTPVIAALEWALKNIKVEHNTRLGIAQVLKHVSKAIEDLHYDRMEIGQVKRKHVKFILEKCGKLNPNWSANMFNHYRKYLSMLYKVLVDIDVVDSNPMQGIPKQLHLSKIREILTKQQRIEIHKHLRENYYTFWRFMQIFFHSGARITEMLNVKESAVDLQNQRYKVIVKKGKKLSEQYRVIKTIALPFWEEVLSESGKGDYLFSKGLKPGPTKIRREQISRRWHVHVKEKLGVTGDFYALKHLNTTEVVELLSDQHAAKLNGHTTTAMVRSIYDVNRIEREGEKLKGLANEF